MLHFQSLFEDIYCKKRRYMLNKANANPEWGFKIGDGTKEGRGAENFAAHGRPGETILKNRKFERGVICE